MRIIFKIFAFLSAETLVWLISFISVACTADSHIAVGHTRIQKMPLPIGVNLRRAHVFAFRARGLTSSSFQCQFRATLVSLNSYRLIIGDYLLSLSSNTVCNRSQIEGGRLMSCILWRALMTTHSIHLNMHFRSHLGCIHHILQQRNCCKLLSVNLCC